MTVSSLQRFWLTVAVMLVLLGMGNVLIGTSGQREYGSLLKSALSGLSDAPTSSHPPSPFPTTINIDQQTEYIKRLDARLSFYGFVTLGGKCFLAVAGIMFLGILLSLTPRSARPPQE